MLQIKDIESLPTSDLVALINHLIANKQPEYLIDQIESELLYREEKENIENGCIGLM
jgi:hypothetical protein